MCNLVFLIQIADDLLHWCRKTGMSIHEIVMENENAWRTEKETKKGLLTIWRGNERMYVTVVATQQVFCRED